MLDQDPLLVYGEKTERTRLHEGIEGELILKEAPLDPVADLVVRRMVDLNWTERASTQVGRVIGPGAAGRPRALHPPALRRPLGARGEAMSDRYVIISADGHCWPPAGRDLPALPRRADSDRPSTRVGAPQRSRPRRQARRRTSSTSLDGDLERRGSAWHVRPGRAARSRTSTPTASSADVLFADADAITGMGSPPFGAGLSAGEIEDPDLAFAGAQAHNRFLAELCSTEPGASGRHRARPRVPRSRHRSVQEVEWVADQPGIRGVMIPTMWREQGAVQQ